MPTRGRTSFNKRQKEQQRKERNQQKIARRQQRKDQPSLDGTAGEDLDVATAQPGDLERDLEAQPDDH